MSRQKVDGFKDLNKALLQLDKHTARKSVARRVLKKAGQPLADKMNTLAPDDPSTSGGLHEAYSVSTKLNKSQKREMRGASKQEVFVFVGTSDPAGLQQEFGNVNHAAQPHVRPAWDSGRRDALESIKADLGTEIVKSVERQARKKAKAGG